MKTRLLTSLIAFLCLNAGQATVPSPAYACSCIRPLPGTPTPGPREELELYEAVFVGKVLQIYSPEDNPGTAIPHEQGFGQTIIFETTATWKGITQSQVAVMTGRGGGDCGVEFQEGAYYLIYGGMSEAGENVATHICTPTRRVGSVGEAIRALGEGRPPSKQVTLIEATSFAEPIEVVSTEMSFPWLALLALGTSVIAVGATVVWLASKRR